MRRKKANPLIRSVLFCPTDKVSLIEKALGVGKNSSLIADVVVLDLEDSVSPAMKEKARENIIQVMNNINDSHQRKIPKTLVRINCALTTDWGIDDLKLISRVKLDGLLIPKVNNCSELQSTLSLHQSASTIPVWAMVETAKGILNAHSIAEVSNIESLVFWLK
jgi:citrate lyase beta subunit